MSDCRYLDDMFREIGVQIVAHDKAVLKPGRVLPSTLKNGEWTFSVFIDLEEIIAEASFGDVKAKGENPAQSGKLRAALKMSDVVHDFNEVLEDASS